ncbi:Crp/Fnr family transcriptional regulator [Flavobacterium sp. ANB]|uniref:Crp/Fnr family transcriptional regulator n=1 Tax=unclassified Flavobacterium TaxID=196869 RepID=UPI0012B99978|nr:MULTISPECIES: Crp/Fnr family transcriptional regulator [unclassified Flavobacterium]MBF4516869.1 Crp/Fnr family transcriptional regulator [Flavobacterium sp. ANB]MTD69235.1 cyclic nucleotide-binding domain-containing protein [Flavobacterium sp. LC2016-13]
MQKCTIKDIFKGIEFSSSQIAIAENKFTEIFVEKGTVLLTPGELVPYQYFVFDGCLRTYFITENGKEYTLQFAINDWWISDYTAFFTGEKSMFYIDCVKDATIFKISKESMEQLYKDVPQIESFFRIKMERFFGSYQKRILSDLALSAEEKYLRFLKSYPNIEKHIKNYHLASYLGITTESLSRVRNELAKK